VAITNAEADWDSFDPDAYFEHYYGDPHPDDDIVARRAATALRDHANGRTDLDIVDVGTGANLIPLLAALPAARQLTAWEFAATNIRWLKAEAQRSALRPQWMRFWQAIAPVYGLEDFDLPQRLRAALAVQQGSIFDLPAQRFDAATMFFCAESITHVPDEFASACKCFARSVRSGGALVAAFLAGSGGYQVGGVAYPAVPVTEAIIAAIFAPLVQQLSVETIGLSATEVRSGYSGMVFLSATAA
jgi:hypothetical protein